MKHSLLLLASLFISVALFGKYEYTLRWDKPNTHTLWVELSTQPQNDNYTDVQIATWRPGRYIAQDYAAAVSDFSARDQSGKTLRFTKLTKNTWRIFHETTTQVKVKYSFYANNEDAGSSYYSDGQVYFNPINLFVYVPGRMDEEVSLSLPELPSSWMAATALTPTRDPRIFTAASFHEFADSPTVFSDKMKKMMFRLKDVTFFLYFQGDYKGDAEVDSTIIQSLRAVVAEQGAIFGGFPFKTFHFIYRLLDFDLRHAVEHANSTSVVIPSRVTANPATVVGGIIGISSHEFFHAWNVKRIRPLALLPYDYNQEQYTGLHWFTEGVTDYYSTLTMMRAGVISEEKALSILANGMTSIEANYAYAIVSPYYSSMDSWLSTSTYAHPFLKNSFYTLGQRLGFVMDVRLRVMSKGEKSLDDVFRYLYSEVYLKNNGIAEDGIQKALETVSGVSWKDFFDKYVYGVEKMDFSQLFQGSGLLVKQIPSPGLTLEKIGVQQFDKGKEGWFVKKIHPAGEAYSAGVGLNDLITSINDKKIADFDENTFFASLKVGDKIRLTFITAQGVFKTESLIYKGDVSPKTYSISRTPTPTPAENIILAGWSRPLSK